MIQNTAGLEIDSSMDGGVHVGFNSPTVFRISRCSEVGIILVLGTSGREFESHHLDRIELGILPGAHGRQACVWMLIE